MAEKDTIVGLPEPDARGGIDGGIYRFLSMLSPTEFTVVEPRKSVTIDDMGGYSLVKPGQYEFEGFAAPQIVTAGIDAFKALMDDPVEATKSGVAGAAEGFADEIRKGMRVASGGEEVLFDPETQTYDRFSPLDLLVASGAPIAYGTARSIKAMTDADGVSVGMFGGKDSKFGSNVKTMLKEARLIRSNPDQAQAFQDTSSLQRGFPEGQMTALQGYMGGGVNSFAIEHGGDLLHRMTEKGGNFSELAKPKVKSLLRVLESPYGFEREVAENMRANHLYDLKTSKERGTPSKASTLEEFEQNIHKGLSEYASLHSTLPVFNELQLAARNVAVALGRRNYTAAIQNLRILDDAIEDGSFEARNLEFDPDFESKAAVSESGPVVLGMMGGSKPVTVRSLGGGKGGITGLAHGIKLYDQQQIITPNLEEAFFKAPGSGIMSLNVGDQTVVAPSERYSMDPALLRKHAGTTMSKGDIVKEFGLSNRVRSIITDNRATSAEINRPGFSLSTNPVLSLTGFATSDFIGTPARNRLEGLVAAAPAEKLYVKSGELDADGQPIYRQREMTQNDVQNLSPAQYLLAAYDPDKPLLKKPNTKYNESEVHIAEDASHALNIRPLTAREGEDVVRQLDFEQVAKREAEKAVFNIESFVTDRTPTTTGPNLHDQNRLGTAEHRNIVDLSMKQLASAVQNPAAIGAFNLREIEGNAYYFAKALVEQSKQASNKVQTGPKLPYHPGDAELLVSMYPEPLKSPVSNGQRLYEAAVKFKQAKEIEAADYLAKKPLVEAGAKLQTELLRNALTGESAKYSQYFMYAPDLSASGDLAKLRPAKLYELIPDSGGLIDGLARISAMNDGYSGKGLQYGRLNTAKELTDLYRSQYKELFDQAVAIFGEIDENGVFRRTMPYKFYRKPNIETDLPDRGEFTTTREGREVKGAYYEDFLNSYQALYRNLDSVLEMSLHGSRPDFRAALEGYEFPEDLKFALMQIYDSNLSRERAFAGSLNKLPEAKEFNQVYRNSRQARDEFFEIVRELGGAKVAGTGGKRGFDGSMLPAADSRTSRLAARIDADPTYEAFRDALRNRQPGGNFLSTSSQELYDNAVKNLRLGPRPGAELYEEGGEVVSPDRALDLVADAINKTGRMPLFLKRALNPKTPMTESKETIRLAHDRMGDRFIVYPTLFPMNTPDGPRLTELGIEAARQKALDSGEYLIFDTEAEASTVAEGFSREIGVDNRPVQGGGVGDFIPYMIQ